jgi:hypothetical protein
MIARPVFPPSQTYLLQDLGKNGDGGIHRVGDDEVTGFGSHFGGGLCNGLDNTGVDVEKVVSGHAWFTRNTRGNHDHVASLQGSVDGICALVASHFGGERDVRKICSHTRCMDDVVQVQFLDAGVQFEQHG